MALIHFREARPDELGQIAELTALAFEDYPLFVVARKGRRNARGVDEAMFALQRAETRLYLKYQVCLVGTIDDEIVAAALMDNPHKKKTTRWQYLRCGGMTLATNFL